VSDSEHVPDEQLVDHYNKSMTDLLDKVAPLQSQNVTNRYKPQWMTDDILEMKRAVQHTH
jgi:metal-sulfur cluster biosynthetic enzyme